MTIGELFEAEKLTKDLVAGAGDINSYYEKACDFIIENWNTNTNDLSEAQYRWCGKIHEDLTEKRIEGRL